MPADVAPTATELTRQWDKASKGQRVALLSAFIKRHRGSTAAEIERDLGPGALLFFTRLTAWLRLTYRLGTALSVQLSALSLFLQGQRYLTQFMEVGGIQTLADILSLARPEQREDKLNAALLLLHFSNSGRVYREMVCDGQGAEMLVRATLHETDDRCLELLGSLFLALGQGNPRKASAVHSALLYIMRHGNDRGALCAAAALRSLQLAKQTYSGSGQLGVGGDGDGDGAGLLDALFHLLRSDNVKLRFEGTELLTMAAQNNTLLGAVIRRCLETLDFSDVTIDADDTTLRPEQHQKAGCGRVLCNVTTTPLSPDGAELVLVLFARLSVHLALGRFIRQRGSHDLPAVVDCCRALRRLCIGPYASAVGTVANETVTRATSEWLGRILGPALYEQLLEADEVTEEMAIPIAAAIAQSAEEDTRRAEEAQLLQAEAEADHGAEEEGEPSGSSGTAE